MVEYRSKLGKEAAMHGHKINEYRDACDKIYDKLMQQYPAAVVRQKIHTYLKGSSRECAKILRDRYIADYQKKMNAKQ